MRTMYLAVMCMICSGAVWAQEQNLFNGEDLTGWDGEPGWWYVEDGAITSESTPEKPCRKATYLVWTNREPADFELTLDFRLSPNTTKANSGVQIRSERRPDWDTFGYQADMTGDGNLVGFVYHHGRGLIAARGEKVNISTDGKREAAKLGDAEKLKEEFKPGEWNHYRIVCSGPDITLYVNGVLMCEFSDHDPKQARSNGFIALQMHPGPPMKVQFRNIVLKTLVHIGSQTSTDELLGALESDDRRLEVSDALLARAEMLLSNGRKDKAAAIYDALRVHPNIPGQVRAAAVRGSILLGGEKGMSLLTEVLRSSDDIAADAAARAAMEMKPAAAVALAAELDGLPAERKVLLAGALGVMGDPGALPPLLHAAKTGNAPVRMAAIKAVSEIGGENTIAPLVEWMSDPDPAIAKAATEGLAGLRGSNVDEAVINSLTSPDQVLQLKMIALAADRRIMVAKPVLAGLMKGQDEPVRLAAVKNFGRLAGTDDLPILLDTIVASTQPGDITELGKAIVIAYRNGGEEETCAPLVAASIEKATTEAKPTLEKVLARIEGPEEN